LRIDNGKYGIAVFCRNCLGEFYPVTVGPFLFGGANAQYLSIDSYRVVGVTLDAKL
jgi:iron complex outermembrane receptor protein